jgi:hypothetical protein
MLQENLGLKKSDKGRKILISSPGRAKKKRGALLRRVGFPVYNLMKSFRVQVRQAVWMPF